MTDSNFCCLCASDEGVFLDIFDGNHRQLGNRSFVKEFETCLSFEVNKRNDLSSKICHRCAIELGQCNQFVLKYNQVNKTSAQPTAAVLKKSCCLCLSSGKKNYLFALAKDFRSTIDPLQKIYECFNKQITREEAERRSICLLCRYNLDVLYDLKKLAGEVNNKLQNIAHSKAILASLPKTKTFVVNRKTTVICQAKVRVQDLSDSDTESDTMARRGSRAKKSLKKESAPELKLRTCGQCHSSIETGVDMYRLHSTGVTVCKMCWITMDPFNTKKATKRKRKNDLEAKNTKLCAVFLTDVLSKTSPKDNSHLKDKKDDVLVISDDSSDSETKSHVLPKRNLRKRRHTEPDESNEESENNLNLKIKPKSKPTKVLEDSRLNKKLKSIQNEEKSASSTLRRSSRYQSSDSESVKGKSKQKEAGDKRKNVSKVDDVKPADKEKKTKPNKLTDSKRKGVSAVPGKSKSEDSTSSSESGAEPKEAGDKRRNLLKVNDVKPADKGKKTKPNKLTDSKRKGVSAEPGKSKSEDSTSSNASGAKRSLRKVRNKVPLILKPELPDISKSKKNVKLAESRTTDLSESPVVSKNSNLQSNVKNPSPKSKKAKSLMMVSFPFKLKDPYECKVCRTEYRNKIVGMKHELTHFKQVEIRIEKLNITHHFQTANQTSTTSELPEASCSLGSESTNEKPHQPEVPTSTSPLGSEADQGKKSDLETEDKGNVDQQSRRSSSVQPADKSADIDNVEETDAVSSSNGPPAEESLSITKEPETKAAENTAVEELNAEISNDSNKNDTSIAEADSATEVNPIEENITVEELNETVDEDKREKTKETVNEIEVEVDKIEEILVAPSTETATSEAVEEERDVVEEVESDTDIRIIDSGSSAEDSRERIEKRDDDIIVVENDSGEKNKDDELVDKVIESKPSDEVVDISEDEPKADIIAEKLIENDEDTIINSNDLSSRNDEESINANASNTESKKIEEDAQPRNAVNEILQEVIDLATAEVQKRGVEEEVSSVTEETLENISKEITKTGEESAAEKKLLVNLNAAINEETESCKLDLNSTEKS